MRVVLDGVFNHASRGFWPFHHVLENGPDSPYVDWFIIHGWPLRPYTSDADHPPNYACWWDLPALPKLNTANPGVREMIFDVARHWLAFGIDGWRLDVPQEIDDDAFWRAFRRVVKEANPEAYLCGEIREEARRWLQGDQFDAVMNYIFADLALSFFGAETLRRQYRHPHLALQPLDGPAFAAGIEHMHALYDWEINQVQLNLLDSHDMARALWIMGDDRAALKLCVLFQMTTPGAPCIYYGDETGMSSPGDPHCRAAFPWGDESAWDHDLLAFYRRVTALRHRHPVLRVGEFQMLYAAGRVVVFQRTLGRQEALVAFNAGRAPASCEVDLPEGPRRFRRVWPEDGAAEFSAPQGRLRLELPPQAALVGLQEG